MLSSLFSSVKKPDLVSSDEIIPLHWFEDGLLWKKVIAYTLFVFDERLDVETLHGALERLVQRDGYKKLGGRLRRNAQGQVEYHVPAEFNASRPAVHFTHSHHDMAAAEHPIASKIPKPGNLNSPKIVGDPEELSDLVRPNGKTLSLDDYLFSDRAILGLHVTSFQNMTCAVLSWPHLAFDVMGKKAIIDGWTLMLQGRESEIELPIGYDEDPLAEFGKHATDEHLLASKRLGTAGMVTWGVRNAVGLVGPKEIRMVCVPAVFWQKMYADCCHELAEEAASQGKEKPFITEGDVLVAWWTRICASHLGRDSSTTVTAQNSMSLRKVLQNDLLPPSRPFIGMALGFPTVVLPASELLGNSLSWVAMQFRKAINEQGTRVQVEAYAQLQREFSSTMRMPLMFGDSGVYNLLYSNWQKAGLFNHDFAGAAAKPRSTPLHASYIHCVQDPGFTEGWPISGKDAQGNYWIHGFRARGLWAGIEKELERQVTEGLNYGN